MTHPIPPQLLTFDEVAQIAAITPRLVRTLVQTRRLPSVKVGRNVRVRADDLALFIAANTRTAVQEMNR